MPNISETNAEESKDAIIAGNLVPQSIPDFMDLKFDPGEAQCSTKNVEKDLEMLKNIEMQKNDQLRGGHKKEIKMNTKTIEDLEDEFDSTQEAFEDRQEFRDTKVDTKMPFEYQDEFDSTEEFLLQKRDTQVQDTLGWAKNDFFSLITMNLTLHI